MLNVENQLRTILEKNLVGEKILIVPSYSAGRQVVERCVRHDVVLLNLKTDTLLGLANQVCKQWLLQAQQTLIPPVLAKELIIEILKGLSLSGQLDYFKALEATSGFSRALYQAIIDLKMSGLSAEQISPTKFVNTFKGEDIRLIWIEYEKELKNRKYLDQADLLKQALNQIERRSRCMYIVPSNLKLTTLEQNFLEVLTNGKHEVIEFARPVGMVAPQNSIERYLKASDNDCSSPFNSLLTLGDLPEKPIFTKQPTIMMFRSYGETNEVCEVLRRIKKREIPFDQAAVYFTTMEPYSHLFYTLAQQLNIPVTFGTGIDIRYTAPGRFYFSLLNWAEGNFKVSDFVPLLINREFKIPEKNTSSKSFIIDFFRTSNIGWGRERCLSILERELATIKSNIQSKRDLGAEGNLDIEQTRLENLQVLSDLINEIFSSLPELDSNCCLSYGGLAGWLHDLVNRHSSVFNVSDDEAKTVILERLKLIKNSFRDIILQPEEAFARLTSLMDGKRVQVSNPKAGSIHIDHYRSGLWSARPNVFIVGLDAQRFPGSSLEDPILLDLERNNLSNGLSLYGFRPKENFYDFIQFLGSLTNTLTVSYSAFNTAESRSSFPSSVLLQIHRLMSNNKTLTYSHLLNSLGVRKGFTPLEQDESLEEVGWWLSSLSSGQTIDKIVFESLYPTLASGLKAEIKRNELELSQFDGNVDIDGFSVDPTKNTELVMSCSQLETLARCPFAYFLKYVLKIKPLEDITFDPSHWLDAKTKGDLYHTIYENFYRNLLEKGESPEVAKHENYLYEIADELIAQKKSMIPPPSELVFESERRSVLESCRVFLKAEENEVANGIPKHLELTFGMSGDDEGKNFEAVPIQLPNGQRFFLRGRIDRVDESADGLLKVWDYKTGSDYHYTDNGYFKGGRQLQHALYPLALEWLFNEKGLRTNPKVVQSGYIFPTMKGQGKRVARNQLCRESLYEILGHLFTLLEQGNFVMTDDDNDCHLCDFREACNRHYRPQETMEKMMIDEFRRLRSYA